MKTGSIQLDIPYTPLLKRGLDRIRDRSPMPVDILHGRTAAASLTGGHAWILEIGALPPVSTATDRAAQLAADSWAVSVAGKGPTRVTLRANSDRARLFALYHIAECLAAGKEPADWAVERRPRVPRRYAWVSAGNCWSPVFRPDQFKHALDELPGLGINGVILTFTPTHGTHYGRETIPFTLTTDGVTVNHHKLVSFRHLMEELKSYGLDIHLMHQAFTPPPFTAEMVRGCYAGKRELPGFEGAIEKGCGEMAASIFTHLPQVDGLLFHSLECDWMWGDAVSIFPCQNDKAAGGAFAAYLQGLTQACRSHGKDLMYWTHVCGVSARQIRLQHALLAKFPEVLVVEDHAWPNNMWPFAPVMGHIASDLQRQVVQGRFGLSIHTTDGEYYGAGSLPTAWPEPHIRCAKAAVELGAELSFVRLNEQSLTPLGTLEDINAIHVIGTTEQWWENPRPDETLWQESCARRFGAAAATSVVAALTKSREFINKGVSAGGLPLIDHSGLAVDPWEPGSVASAWDVFARPGERLVNKPYDTLVGGDFRPWQVQARGVALDEFLRNSHEAETAMQQALAHLEGVRDRLAPADATYLTTCFQDAVVMILAVRCTAVAARANALVVQVPTEENRTSLAVACKAMEVVADQIETENGAGFRPVHWILSTKYKGQDVKGYGVPLALRVIADKFRTQVPARSST